MQEVFRIFPWIIVENMVKYLYFKTNRRKSTMKRILLSLLAVVFCLSLAACGSGETAGDTAQDTASGTTAENPNEVDTISYETEKGTIVYTGYEFAEWALVENNQSLTENDQVLILKFDFTNKQTNPAQVQSAFQIQAFQNGVEITDNLSWSSGGSQYDMISNYFSDVLKGGTISFGCMFPLEDSSPVTIMVSDKDGDENAYQMMTIEIDQDIPAADSSITEEQVEEMLQGTWNLSSSAGGSGTFTFDQGSLTVVGGGSQMNGTYTIDLAGQMVSATLQATDGSVRIELPFQVEGDALQLFNTAGENLIKE